MGSQTAPALSALGTLIGYIGAEAASEDVFERLLWPQRFFNAFSWQDTIQVGLLNPMGGPMHKAALNTLERFYQNELFRGRDLGHMLGTAFFHDTGLTYTTQEPPLDTENKKGVRNGLWVQSIARLPIPTKAQTENNPESGVKSSRFVRARSVVNILELSYADRNVEPMKTVKHDAGLLTYRTLLAILWSEITALAVGLLVLRFWRSYFCLLWFLPLALRTLSAIFTMRREGFLAKPLAKETDLQEIKHFDVNTRGHGRLVIKGKETAVLQFFRHYGHPIRSRAREILQISIIVTFGLLFPLGLVCSLIWMPVELQYVWIGYQLYATIATYVYRFTRAQQWATSSARLAQKLSEGNGEERIAYLQDDNGIAMKGKLTRIYVGNHGEGQKVVQSLVPVKPR